MDYTKLVILVIAIIVLVITINILVIIFKGVLGCFLKLVKARALVQQQLTAVDQLCMCKRTTWFNLIVDHKYDFNHRKVEKLHSAVVEVSGIV